MNYLFSFFVFVFGLIVGSFLNCLIYRLEKKESFLRGRSYCPYCQHQLTWQDLIPLFSFFILRGKCRYCKNKISWQYPLIELLTGTIFLFIFYFFPNFSFSFWQNCFPLNYFFSFCGQKILLEIIFLLLISCFLIIIFVYDFKHYIIPDKIVYPAIVIAFLYQLFKIWNFGNEKLQMENLTILFNPLISAIGAGLFFFFIVFLSQGRWMGFGDVKLSFFMGLFLGFPNILISLFLAFFVGAIIGIGLIFLKKKTLKSEIPFGPFLVSGFFLTLFFGQKILNFWTNLATF